MRRLCGAAFNTGIRPHRLNTPRPTLSHVRARLVDDPIGEDSDIVSVGLASSRIGSEVVAFEYKNTMAKGEEATIVVKSEDKGVVIKNERASAVIKCEELNSHL